MRSQVALARGPPCRPRWHAAAPPTATARETVPTRLRRGGTLRAAGSTELMAAELAVLGRFTFRWRRGRCGRRARPRGGRTRAACPTKRAPPPRDRAVRPRAGQQRGATSRRPPAAQPRALRGPPRARWAWPMPITGEGLLGRRLLGGLGGRPETLSRVGIGRRACAVRWIVRTPCRGRQSRRGKTEGPWAVCVYPRRGNDA